MWAYVAAWIIAISVTMAVILAGFGALFDSASGARRTTSVLELALGLLLLAIGGRRMQKARRDRSVAAEAGAVAVAEREPPRWLRAVAEITVTEAFLLGVYSSTYPLVIVAAGEIVSGDFGTTEEIALAVVFVVLGSSSVAGVAALATFAAQRSAPLIERMRLWLTLNNQAVVTAILVVFGITLTLGVSKASHPR